MSKLFLLGGFLGSGKTTAIQQACKELISKNIPVGVITNDQGTQLVDSAFIKGNQIAGREVVKGCFCCNYNQLEEAIRSLKEEDAPEIIFAESVGSCTDIVATVIKPLEKFHPELEIIYSVFIDALQLLKKINGEPVFKDEDVNYIYEKQLTEADILVVNKIDLLTNTPKEYVAQITKEEYKTKAVLFQNSLRQEDIQKWIGTLNHYKPSAKRKSPELDYKRYAAGEAKLAWFDDEVIIMTDHHNVIELSTLLINNIYRHIQQRKLPIGHLKFLITAGSWQRKISFTSINELPLKQTASLTGENELTLLINARVQTSPDILEKTITNAFQEVIQNYNCRIEHKSLSAFSPGIPKPTYRFS